MKSDSREPFVCERFNVSLTGEEGADSRIRSEASGMSEYLGVDKCRLSYWYVSTWSTYAGGALDGGDAKVDMC